MLHKGLVMSSAARTKDAMLTVTIIYVFQVVT